MNRKVFTLIMFAVLVFLLGARAATAQWISIPKASEVVNSVSSFFPLIFKNSPAESAIPPGVLYVFPSTATTDGEAGGRSAIQQICPSEDPDSHFCTEGEVGGAFSTGIIFKHPFPPSIVETAPGGEWVVDNCTGWTDIEIRTQVHLIAENG